MNTATSAAAPPPEKTSLRQHLQSLDEAITASGANRQTNLHQYVARHGRGFLSAVLTPDELELIHQIEFQNCLPRQCYRNCQMAALTLPLPDGHTLAYIEGFFSMSWNIGIEHAWLTLNGKLIDPTLRDDGGHPILGIIPDTFQYIGIEMHRDLCRHILPHRKHISLLDDYECERPLLKLPPDHFALNAFPPLTA